MQSIRAIGQVLSGLYGAYNDMNPSTLTGAIDVIIVKQQDDSFQCGPFHIRFGKLGAINPANKIVDVYLNGELVDSLHMRLGSAGDAYFVDKADSPAVDSDNDFVSPIMRAKSVEELPSARRRRKKVKRETTPEKTLDCLAIQSDDGYAKSDASDDRVVLTYHSDNECSSSKRPTESDLVEKLQGESLNWEWGNFPKKTVSPEPETISISVPSSTGSPKLVEPNEKGVYLEDLASVDDAVKQNYIYTPTNLEQNQLVDAGYKSDGENSMTYNENLLDIKLSLCGNLSSSLTRDQFYEYLVTYEEFAKNPLNILSDSNLVILYNGKFYNWAVAGPMIMSMICFQGELPRQSINKLIALHMPKKKTKRKAWFSWAYSGEDSVPDASRKPSADAAVDLSRTLEAELNKEGGEIPNIDIKEKEYFDSDDANSEESSVCNKKRNRLTNDEIHALNLHPGLNEFEFRVTTQYQGQASCFASVYLWNWQDKIIVSDVDGTITKSDVLGHVLPMIGKDWTHSGVAKLYSQLENSGYRFLYLSARALGQASVTRSYLRDVIQDERFKLPAGPILLSPNSLLYAFHQEVIVKTPEKFKIQCLNDVKNLFPSEPCPLYAGFGNKINDVKAYTSVGIDAARIFTINPKGVVCNEFLKVCSTTYEQLCSLADHFFPILDVKHRSIDINDLDSHLPCSSMDNPIELQNYSSFSYWNSVIERPIDFLEQTPDDEEVKQ